MDVIKQHYISKYILRNFTDEDNKLPIKYVEYDAKNQKKGVSGWMYEEYFYEHEDYKENEIEKLLGKRETLYKGILDKILAKPTCLTIEEYDLLLEFRHVTYYRASEFRAFHNFKKTRSKDSDWRTRLDWNMLHGYSLKKNDDMIKSQLDAIQSVIGNDDNIGNSIRKMSMLIPIYTLVDATDSEIKFNISDCGSITFGGEFDGMTVVVISPDYAICFPRPLLAIELCTKILKRKPIIGDWTVAPQINFTVEQLGEKFVENVNKAYKQNAYKYIVDSNSNV